VVAPTEIVLGLRLRAGFGFGLQPLVGIERMLGPLPFLLIDKLLARGRELALRIELRGVGTRRLGRRARRRAGEPAYGRGAGREALQPAFLIQREFGSHPSNLHPLPGRRGAFAAGLP
jgi:hypothetical protein